MQIINRSLDQPLFIYFDLDNTLLDHTRAEREALKDTQNYFDLLSEVELDTWQHTYHQVNVRLWDQYGRHEIDRKYLQHHRFSDTLDTLELDSSQADTIAEYYITRYPYHWHWIEGADEAFDSIRTKFDIGILTNGFTEIQKKKFDRFNLYDIAKHIVISEEVGFMKPQPEIFEHATKLTGFDPESILYVGDSYTSDIMGGSQWGWKTAWYTNETDPDKIQKADFIFDDFQDLLEMLNI